MHISLETDTLVDLIEIFGKKIGVLLGFAGKSGSQKPCATAGDSAGIS